MEEMKNNKKPKPTYVISSCEFETKPDALKQIRIWKEQGNLDEEARIYEVVRKFKPSFKSEAIYQLVARLEEV